MRCVVALVLLAAVSCGVETGAPGARAVRSVAQAIVGGTDDPNESSVFVLVIVGDNGQASMCTATLIDKRTLMTAAHCVDPAILGATSVDITASNVGNTSEIVYGHNTWHVVETRRHPSWNPVTLSGDLALALLDHPVTTVTPKPFNAASLSALGGEPLRAVGYGTTGPSSGGDGQRRTVDLTIRQVSPTRIMLGNQVDMGICHGDSGGPSFHTFNGEERVVGVHSYTVNQNCLDGADTRVDAYAAFIQQWLTEKEAPSCGEDGRCVAGCPTPDIDCVCVPDGTCNPDCPDATKDPDCDADCVPNGVCARGPCPRADQDCVATGDHCTSNLQCPGRKCVIDAQHATPYCSLGCAATTDCSAVMACDASDGVCRFRQLPPLELGQPCAKGAAYCGVIGVCTGESASEAQCAVECSATQCPPWQRCATGYDGVKFCQTPPAVRLPVAKLEGPAKSGCGAAPEGLLTVLAAAALRRRRGRLASP